jgi:beta-glucosidase
VKPLQGIREAVAADGVEVLYCPGAQITPTRVRKGRPIPPRFNRAYELQKAVDMARQSDVVFLFVGTTADVEVEGRDRETLALPGNQQELVDAVCAANPNVVVMLMSAGPLAVPAVKQKAAAALQAWWPGDEGGTAIADVLFGRYNPAGKLPYTMYASDAQVPPTDEYDISKGFTYMYLKGRPLYAFGHGLSYTTFRYSDLQLSHAKASAGDVVSVSLKVKNTGSRSGEEVVQLYVKDEKSTVVRPDKELRRFKRIALDAGAEQEVSWTLPVSELAFYDEAIHDFRVEPGGFRILLGSASDDIRLIKKIDIK